MKLSPELAAKCPQSDTPVNLVGSVDQISWASAIRRKMMTKLGTETLAEDWADQETVYKVLIACEDATWFIANRHKQWFEMNWDWLALSHEERAKRRKGGYGHQRRPLPRDEDHEDSPRTESSDPPVFYLLAIRQTVSGKSKVVNVVVRQSPEEWLIGALENGQDVALVGGWKIGAAQYTRLRKVL